MRTKRIHRIAGALAGMAMMLGMTAPARGDVQVGARIQIHPGPVDDLQIWVWPDRGEGATYAIGDPISMNVEVNRDCFLILYNIDTRGNLRILFPYDPWEDNFVSAGDVIRFPRPQDGYDWTVDGPSGTEYVQAIATEFPVNPPDWPVYMRSVNHGGAVCPDAELRDFRAGDNRLDYIRVVNRKIAGRFWDWCATDLATFYVHPRYYRHVSFDDDPWPDEFYGEVYIHWPAGGKIFIDNVFIGFAPLWVPRRYYGHHVITCYEGVRLIRRHAFEFHPKRDFRYRIGGLDNDDVREHGYVKQGRRDGVERFGENLERYKAKGDGYRRNPAKERADDRSEGRIEQFKEQRSGEQTVEPQARADESRQLRRKSSGTQERKPAVEPTVVNRRDVTKKPVGQNAIPESRPEQPRRQKEAGPGWSRAVTGALAGTVTEGKSSARHETRAEVSSKKAVDGDKSAAQSKPGKSKERVGKSKQERSGGYGDSKHEKRR